MPLRYERLRYRRHNRDSSAAPCDSVTYGLLAPRSDHSEVLIALRSRTAGYCVKLRIFTLLRLISQYRQGARRGSLARGIYLLHQHTQSVSGISNG